MKKKIAVVSASVVCVLIFVFAVVANKFDNRKAMFEEIKSYVEKNVIPVVKEQRIKFDAELSQTEKQEIVLLREKLQIFRDEKEKMKEMHKKGERPTEEQISQREEKHAQVKEIMNKATVIADNHEVSIKLVFEETKEQRDQWHVDIMAIVEKYMGEKPDSTCKGHRGMRKMPFDKFTNPARFILFDPAKPFEFHSKHHGMHHGMDKGHKKHGISKEKREEIKIYVNKNIIPVMNIQREKLNLSLTVAEQQKVLELQAKLKELRTNKSDKNLQKNNRNDFRNEMHKGRHHANGHKHGKGHRNPEKHAIFQEAKNITDVHTEIIANLFDEIAIEKETWTSDIEAIIRNNISENDSTCHKQGRGAHKLNRMFKPEHFLLFNTDEQIETDSEIENGIEDVNIYPNPASVESNLTYTVKTSGVVTISLLNGNGEVIMQVVNEQKEVGTYTDQVNVNEFNTGVYYYKIETINGVSTYKFLIQK